MTSPWLIESRDAGKSDLQMPQGPDSGDLEAVWQYLENALNRIMFEPSWGTDIPSLVGLYTAVYNYCSAGKPVGSGGFTFSPITRGGAHLQGEELYMSLKNHLRVCLGTLKQRFMSLSGHILLDCYLEECTHYTNAAQFAHHVFRYLERHWIKRERDEGKTSIYDIYILYLVLWHDELFKEISHLLVDAVSELVEKHRKGENMEIGTGKALIEYIVSLRPDGRDLSIPIRDVYGNFLETPLRITIEASDDSLPAFLYNRPVTEYVHVSKSACTEMEERLITLVLHSGFKQPLTDGGHAPGMVKLVPDNLTVIEVDQKAAECSYLIRNLCAYFGREILTREIIPLPNVTELVLCKVLEWCEHHKNDPDTGGDRSYDIDEWDQKYFSVDEEMLFEIILAANYLEIKPLLATGSAIISKMIIGNSPNEIRKILNMTNDFTPEEEDQIRRENEWAEDR